MKTNRKKKVMGILLNPTLGTPKGKAGGFVFRNVKGRTIFSSLPINGGKTNSAEVLEGRDRFKELNPLFDSMMMDFYIRSIWEKSKIQANSPRNKLMKINFSLFGKERDITNIVIAPFDNVFTAEPQSIEQADSSLVFTLEPLILQDIADSLHYEASIHGIIHLFEPVDKNDSFRFVSFASDTIQYRNNVPLVFNIPLGSQTLFNFPLFLKKKFSSVVIITGNLKEPELVSTNICGEL